MKKYIFGLLFTVAIYYVSLGISDSIRRSEAEVLSIEKIQERDGVPVIISIVQRRDLTEKLVFTGSIKGSEQADASAKVLEKIDRIYVSVGSKVGKDQLLLDLDKSNPASGLRQVNDMLEQAKRDLQRNKELLEAGAISTQVYDKTELGLKIAQANYDAVIRTHEIRAPISGTVTDIFYETGETVSPGLPVIRIAKYDKVIIEIEVGELEIPLIKKGQRAIITTRSFEGEEFEGEVKNIALSKDPSTRNYIVKVLIPNIGLKLKPGMFAEVVLIIESHEGEITVPKDAIFSENDKSFIFKVNGLSAEKIEIQLGLTEGDWTAVNYGLEVNDNIVVEGQNRLKDGSKILIVK